jgi:Tfp pilus assembly protein PilF
MAGWSRGLVSRQAFPTDDYGLGQFHYFRAEMGPAFAHFSQAIDDSDGAYPELYNNLGAAALFQGRHDDARRAFELVLEANPEDPYATKKLAELSRKPGSPAP